MYCVNVASRQVLGEFSHVVSVLLNEGDPKLYPVFELPLACSNSLADIRIISAEVRCLSSWIQLGFDTLAPRMLRPIDPLWGVHQVGLYSVDAKLVAFGNLSS